MKKIHMRESGSTSFRYYISTYCGLVKLPLKIKHTKDRRIVDCGNCVKVMRTNDK